MSHYWSRRRQRSFKSSTLISWSSLALSPFNDKHTPPRFGHADPVEYLSDYALQGGTWEVAHRLHFDAVALGSNQSRDNWALFGLPGRLEG